MAFFFQYFDDLVVLTVVIYLACVIFQAQGDQFVTQPYTTISTLTYTKKTGDPYVNTDTEREPQRSSKRNLSKMNSLMVLFQEPSSSELSNGFP